MSSLQKRKRKKGTAYVIQFVLQKERRALFLDAKYKFDDALAVQRLVDRYVDALELGAPVDRRAQIAVENSPDLRERFVAAGLIDDGLTLDELFARYCSCRNWKASTRDNVERSFDSLLRVLDGATPIRLVSRDDAQAFVQSLAGFSRATFATRVRIAKSLFKFAVDNEWIARSPFALIVGGSYRNKSREYYVDMATFARMLETLDDEEKALLTLYRVAGLRASEPLILTWRDVDFKKGRLTVYSPKTNATRVVPLFPAVRDALTRIRGSGAMFPPMTRQKVYYTVEKALRRAGLPPYPRLVQNLRSSASVDIYKEFGEVCENAWLGHTLAVAKAHYLHETDEDFNAALRWQKSVAKSVAQTRQKSSKSVKNKKTGSPRQNAGTRVK
mgnify:CR=1 FL=1